MTALGISRVPSRKVTLAAWGGCFVLACLVFERFLRTGALAFYGESSSMADPLEYYVMKGLWQGRLLLWNSHVFGGVPTYMDGYSNPFGPLHLLSFIFRYPDVQEWKAILMLTLVGMGGFGYLYHALRLRWEAALFGMVAFILSPLVVNFPDGHIMYHGVFFAYAMLPWSLWMIDGALRTSHPAQQLRSIGASGLVIGSAILNSHLNSLAWFLFFTAVYTLWRLGQARDRRSALRTLFVIGGLSGLLGAPVIFSWLDTFPMSQRAFMAEHLQKEALRRLSWHPEVLSGLFLQAHSRHGIGSFHAGFPVVLLGLLAALAPKTKEERFFGAWLLYAVALILLSAAPLRFSAASVAWVPSVNFFRRGAFMVVSSLVVLASLRLHAFLETPTFSWKELRSPALKIAGIAVYSTACYFLWRGAHLSVMRHWGPGLRAASLGLLAFLWWRSSQPLAGSSRAPISQLKGAWAKWVWIFPLTLLIIDQFIFFHYRERPTERAYNLYYHPAQPQRHVFDPDPMIERLRSTGAMYRTAVFHSDEENIYENLFMVRWISNLSGINRWYNYSGWMVDFPSNYYVYFRDHFKNAVSYGNVVLSAPQELLSEAGKALSVGWVVALHPLGPPFRRVMRQEPLNLYQNPTAYPRAFVIPQEQAGAWDAGVECPYSIQPVRTLEDHGNDLHIELKVSRPSLLVVTDSAYPGWIARMDHQERPVRTLRGVFRGVEVQAGDQQVDLVFQPRFLKFSLGLALLGLLLLGGLWTYSCVPRSSFPTAEP